MLTFIIRRIVQGIGVMILCSFVLYTIIVYLIAPRPALPGGIAAVPGSPYYDWKALMDRWSQRDPTRALSAGDKSVQEQLGALNEAYKLDRPWPASYFAWLFDPLDTTEYDSNFNIVPRGIDVQIGPLHLQGSGVLTGHLGRSEKVATGVAITDLISVRWFNSLLLILVTTLLSFLIAVPMGVLAASRQHSFIDRLFTVFSFSGLSMPPFFLGLMLIILFGVMPHQLREQNNWTWLPYLPVGDVADPGQETDLLNRVIHLILPAATLTVVQVAVLSRYVRFSMLEVMKKNYVRTAYAKGLSRRRVLYKHVLRNALLPIITAFALVLPNLLTGVIVVEAVFNYLGLGQLFYLSVGGQGGFASFNAGRLDNQLALVLLALMAGIVVLSNLVADVLYAVADPRVSYNARGRS